MTILARRLCLFVALVLALSAGTTRAADKVKITTVKNKVLSGVMLVEQYDKIEIEVTEGGAKKKMAFKPAEVRTIAYSPPHLGLRSGESMLKQRRYDKALEKFDAALADKKAGKWVAMYALFYRAEALAKMAATDGKKLAEAIKAYQAFVAKFAKSRFIPNVYVGMTEAHYAAKQYDKMAAALAKLDPKVFGTDWVIRKQLWEARLLEGKGSYDDAQKQFAALAQQAEKAKDNDLRNEAVLSQGICLLKAKKCPEGEKILFKLAKDVADNELRARAYNALGDSLWERKEYNEAHFTFLRVAVLYLNTGEEHAKALYWSSKCFGKRGDTARAKEMRAELAKLHKGSPWAKKK